jgi:hypothetical protein
MRFDSFSTLGNYFFTFAGGLLTLLCHYYWRIFVKVDFGRGAILRQAQEQHCGGRGFVVARQNFSDRPLPKMCR